MKTTILKSVFLFTISSLLLIGCVNEDEYAVPSLECTETNLVKTKEVSEIPASATLTQYLSDDVIEAYVTSSDEGGNFFKTISFQTSPTDGSQPKAFSVPVDATSTFVNFNPGRKVFIKMQNLYTDVSNGGIRFGGIFVSSSSGTAFVGRLPLAQYLSVLNRSCTVKNENDLVRKLTIAQIKSSDANINTLIDIENVQFTDAALGKRYYESTSDVGGATNHLLTDAAGNTIIFRTSSFANFASKNVPSGKGTVRGVLTKFGSDYQFLARTERDVNLNDPNRFTIDLSAPIVGNNISFSGNFTEDFESYSTTSPANKTFPKYINDPVVGSRYWENRTFGGAKYIQMSSFGGTPENNRTLFFVPVDFTAANTISFQSKAGFSNGSALKVYYILASDYTQGGTINNASLVDITSNFTISPGLSNGYPTDFTNSGNYSFGALSGNGYIVFEYVGNGSGGVTTTIQLDNIVVN